MRCIIILNGNIGEKDDIKSFIRKEDFVICCDGALNFCYKTKIKPSLIIGDMDSVLTEILKKYKGIKKLQFPRKKDYTDSDLALKFAAKRFNNIFIFGGIGSRLDHSINNVFLPVQLINKGVRCTFISPNNIFTIFNNNISIKKNNYKYISFLPITKIVSFNYSRGLEYPLNNIVLRRGRSIGISNEMNEDKCYISIKKGVALCVLSRD